MVANYGTTAGAKDFVIVSQQHCSKIASRHQLRPTGVATVLYFKLLWWRFQEHQSAISQTFLTHQSALTSICQDIKEFLQEDIASWYAFPTCLSISGPVVCRVASSGQVEASKTRLQEHLGFQPRWPTLWFSLFNFGPWSDLLLFRWKSQ